MQNKQMSVLPLPLSNEILTNEYYQQFRENEIFTIKNTISNKRFGNIVIDGHIGVGKTRCILHLQSYFAKNNFNFIYVDARGKAPATILSDILMQILIKYPQWRHFLPKKRFSFSSGIQMLDRFFSTEDGLLKYCIFLDQITKATTSKLYSEQFSDMVYWLSRLHIKNSEKRIIGISSIFILDDISFFTGCLSNDVKDSFHFNHIRFKRYPQDIVEKILMTKIENIGFEQYASDVSHILAKVIHERNLSLRFAIDILKRCIAHENPGYAFSHISQFMYNVPVPILKELADDYKSQRMDNSYREFIEALIILFKYTYKNSDRKISPFDLKVGFREFYNWYIQQKFEMGKQRKIEAHAFSLGAMHNAFSDMKDKQILSLKGGPRETIYINNLPEFLQFTSYIEDNGHNNTNQKTIIQQKLN